MFRAFTGISEPALYWVDLGLAWAPRAQCLEMKAHGLGHMFLGCNGFASYAQRVHWAMRDMLSLSAQNYKILGHSGLTFSKGQRQ